ncbi:MAG: translation initiation factor IF-2 [Patescibacteria group bacterium]
MKENSDEKLMPRPPIVAVLGHVDHGKTTLLDFIRKTNLVAKEAGGITQSTGAYEIIHNDKKITFIDTPGHEAFSKMRTRGAQAADLAILVVAADDGVQPQTKESIEILNSTKTPYIIAINKIDKPNADIERTKNTLTASGVFLEGYGGNISWHAISAKSGQGVNELLDLILLAAELENLTFNPAAPAKGVIIEAKMDSNRGVIAAVIIKDGTLRTGEKIATPSAFGKIKILENFLGKSVKELSPSSSTLILGFETLPQTGEEFLAGEDALKIYAPAEKIINNSKPHEATASNDILNILIKADVSGSLETLTEIIKNLAYEDVKINIVTSSIGEITDGDIKEASSKNAIIFGFKTKTNKIAENLAKSQNVKIVLSEIIYELLDFIKKEIELLKKPAPLAEVEILKTFSQKGKTQLIGGKIISGTIRNNIRVKIFRGESEIGFGKITSLKQQKKDVSQVPTGEEFGMIIESSATISPGDRLFWTKEQ